jgi:hypothetical protein
MLCGLPNNNAGLTLAARPFLENGGSCGTLKYD